MSNLTAVLVILGGFVLAAYIGYNTWLLRKHAPRQPEALPPEAPGHGGVELTASPVEPVLHTDPGEVSVTDRHEPLFDPDLPPPTAPAGTSAERRGTLDPLIDVITPIALLEGSLPGAAAVAALPATRRVGSKPIAVEGLNAATGQWEVPAAGQRYSALQIGVQLANRTGALNEIEYSEFVMKAQAFADAVNGMPEFPDMRDEVARARELDQFASGHDAQLAFVLRARHAAWSPAYVQQCAARLGFVAGMMPGRMMLPHAENGAPPVLGLAFDTQAALADDPAQSAIRELSLSLDVPQVDRHLEPFARMREVAAALAREMDGIVTDGDGQMLREETLDAIGADLGDLYDTLSARELAAGSMLARRLFS